MWSNRGWGTYAESFSFLDIFIQKCIQNSCWNKFWFLFAEPQLRFFHWMCDNRVWIKCHLMLSRTSCLTYYQQKLQKADPYTLLQVKNLPVIIHENNFREHSGLDWPVCVRIKLIIKGCNTDSRLILYSRICGKTRISLLEIWTLFGNRLAIQLPDSNRTDVWPLNFGQFASFTIAGIPAQTENYTSSSNFHFFS